MIFIDRLSVAALLHLLPSCVWRRLRGQGVIFFHYFSATPRGAKLLAIMKRLQLMQGQEADYSYVDVRGEDGGLLGPLALVTDPVALCHQVRSSLFDNHPLMLRFAKRFDHNRLALYLEKCLEVELKPILMRINVMSWFQRIDAQTNHNGAILYEARNPWLSYLHGYAATRGVTLRGYAGSYRRRTLPWSTVRSAIIKFTRALLKAIWGRPVRPVARIPSGRTAAKEPSFTMAVPYTGKGVGLDLSINSDLFWVPFVGFMPDQLLVYANRGDDPLDNAKFATLREGSIRSVAINQSAKGGDAVPLWPRRVDLKKLLPELRKDWKLLLYSFGAELLGRGSYRWIASKLFGFSVQQLNWRWFFSSFGVKAHLDFADWDHRRLAADQAIADLGGISISYQRSIDTFPSIMGSSAVDVNFAFSTASATAERYSGTQTGLYVANGYVHDHAFALVRKRASQVRSELNRNGASFIVCFLDEGSVDDKRVLFGHEFRSENYRYLFEKLLADPFLGLVLKPKKPATLRDRLGAVGKLLDAALATGRCYIYQEGVLTNPVYPCEGSAVADVAIGILWGTTAALESRLAGTPTLLLDREHLNYHPLYNLGVGQVVFLSWDSLWQALDAYRQDPSLVPGFGDWGDELKNLDQFRDGRAAQRMGEYIASLWRGLTGGLTKAEALQTARDQYVARWGNGAVVDLAAVSPEIWQARPREANALTTVRANKPGMD